MSNAETTRCCQALPDEKSNDCFSTEEKPCDLPCNESNVSCCERKYDDSLETVDQFEFSSCESSRTMEIDSTISSSSSTRDGCCCQDTASSYVGVHHDLSCLRPRFTICSDKFESPCTATIYQKCPAYDRTCDSCIQRPVCAKGSARFRCQDSLCRPIDQRCAHYGGVLKCCCKRRPRFRPIRRRSSSFDVLHAKGLCRKWSRCSCIVEEDEMDDRCMGVPLQRSTCRSNCLGNDPCNDVTLKCPDNSKDCRIRESVGDCNVRSKEDTITDRKGETKRDDTLETKSKTSSKCLQNPFQRKSKDHSKTRIKGSSAQKINPIIKKSAIGDTVVCVQQSGPPKNVSSSERSDTSAKRDCCCNADGDSKGKRDAKETSDLKGRKQRNLSEKKSKSTFLGRSIRKAMNIVKQSKVTQPNTEKDTLENKPKDVENQGCSRRIEQRKEEETSIRNPCCSKLTVNPNKRPKTKLQTMLAHRRTSKSVNEEISDVKRTGDKRKAERVKDTKGKSELLKGKDASGDFEEDPTKKELAGTKITLAGESRESENLCCQADGYTNEEKCSKPTINACCYCRLPVSDCICECKEIYP